LALQLERLGYDKALTLLQRPDVHRSGEVEWGQLYATFLEAFIDLTASQLAALVVMYVGPVCPCLAARSGVKHWPLCTAVVYFLYFRFVVLVS
jgi:hypothetical protein